MDKPKADNAFAGVGQLAMIQISLAAMPITFEESDSDVTRLQLLPWGTFDLDDKAIREKWGDPGTYHVDEVSAERIPQSFAERKVDYYLNEEHTRGKAKGWLKSVEVVPGEGVFGDFELTESGKDLIKSKEYRYVSSEIQLLANLNTMEAWPIAVVGAALLNNPAIKGMAPVELCRLENGMLDQHQPQPPQDGEKGIIKMGLKEMISGFTGKKIESDEDLVDGAVDLTVKLNSLEVEVANSKAVIEELTAHLAAKDAELAALVAKESDAAAEAAVEKAATDGKIHLASREQMLKLAKVDLAAFEASIEPIAEGTFKPPGKQVSDKARESKSASTLDGTSDLAEITAYQKEHKIKLFHEAVSQFRAQQKGV